MTTLGRFRRLTQCSTAAGHFVVLAIDHRGTIQHKGGFSDAEFAKFKSEVMAVLLPSCSSSPLL